MVKEWGNLMEAKAIIFDLDGVITETDAYHFQAWNELAKKHFNFTIKETFNEQLKGIGRLDALERILALDSKLTNMPIEKKELLANEKNEYYVDQISHLTPHNILPGIVELLTEAKGRKLKLAISSASKNALFILERLEIKHLFDHIVDAGTVKIGKPHPEIFMRAAETLNVPYSNCIGIEDAQAGIEAIQRAKMFSVGVGEEKNLGKADYLVSSTDQLKVDNLLEHHKTWMEGQSLK